MEIRQEKIVDEILKLFVDDILHFNKLTITDVEWFVKTIQLPYGIIYRSDDSVFFSDTISRELGSNRVIIDGTPMEPSEYYIIQYKPTFVQEIEKTCEEFEDIITACMMCKYPIHQLFDPNHVDMTNEYYEMLVEMSDELRPYFRLFSATEMESDSKYEIVHKQNAEEQKYYAQFEEFLADAEK